MASDKQRRKAAKAVKKKPQAGPFRHPDGDRRHREGMAGYRDVMKQKEMLRLIGAVELPPEEGEEEEKAV